MNEYSPKILFVTGGAGFIGSNFILYWLREHPDDKIINFDLLTYAGNLENLISVQKNPRYSFVHGDIRNSQSVKQAMRSADTVVHFAAESHVDRSIHDPSPFITTNIVGTHILLEAAIELGITRFHHISTDEVFGSLSLDSKDKFSEVTRYNPHSPYSASKASSDHLVRAYFDTFNLPITISNCSNNYGPYQFPEKFIPLTITNVLEKKNIPIYGDGKYVRDWLYVEDHCRAIDVILHKGQVGETYCIGGQTEVIDNISIARMICKGMGVDDSCIQLVKDRPSHDRRYAVDSTKIQKELGWKPMHDFSEYIIKTIDWYRTNESWWKNIKTGSYMSYYAKQYGSSL